jgi:hypothetical protein
MYSYQATCEGELTIVSGEIIQVTNKTTGSDAWWEGIGQNGKGQFPISYVQELQEDGVTPIKTNFLVGNSMKGLIFNQCVLCMTSSRQVPVKSSLKRVILLQ